MLIQIYAAVFSKAMKAKQNAESDKEIVAIIVKRLLVSWKASPIVSLTQLFAVSMSVS